MLNLSTPIPTSLRGQVRALVKAHPAWPAYLAGKDIVSANARNADLIEFASSHPTLAAQIETLLDNYAAAAPKECAAVLMLAARVEKLLAEYAARKPRIRIKAVMQTS
jgi:hypothetical protein